MARNGFDNTQNLDSKDLLLPRFGFNWAATDRLTLRGGAGLFGGGVPLIMLSNSYAASSFFILIPHFSNVHWFSYISNRDITTKG